MRRRLGAPDESACQWHRGVVSAMSNPQRLSLPPPPGLNELTTFTGTRLRVIIIKEKNIF